MWLSFLLTLSAVADPPRDLRAEAPRGRCEQVTTSEGARRAAGADQSYVGVFTIAEDGTVTGTEQRLLFANSTWKSDAGEDGKVGADCVNEWDVQGSKTAVSACTTCDFGLTFQADIDYGASTCPQQLVVDGNHYRGAYDVKLKPDGTLEIFFAKSGKLLGHGYWSGNEHTWISKHRCVWL